MVEYLLDASALYPLVLKLRDKLLDYLALMAVLDLTVYEVGNVIWEESRGGRVRAPKALATAFAEVLRGVKVVRVEDRAMADVLELALAEEITFYDAAYLYAARKLGLKLVTEDSDLKRYPEAVSVEELVAELERSRR
jgi:predicted nucleic acid-binding protein